MLLLIQLTSSLFYDLIFVVVFTAAIVVLFGRLAACEQRKVIRKLPRTEGINRAQRRKELTLSGRRRRCKRYGWQCWQP